MKDSRAIRLMDGSPARPETRESCPALYGAFGSVYESFVPEGVAGAGLEVALQFDGGLLIANRDIRDEFPGTEAAS